MKCVYPDLTFGVLDKETVNQRINQSMIESEVPESFYQLYLIKQQSFFSGYYEPVIYIQLPSRRVRNNNENTIELQEITRENVKNNNIDFSNIPESKIMRQKGFRKEPYFNYCIYTDPTDININRLKIIIYDPKSQYRLLSTGDFNENLSTDKNIKMACSILLTIPDNDIFGNLKLERVRRIANNIIKPPQFVGFKKNTLIQPLLSPV